MIEETRIECPYCGEAFETAVDCTAGNQSYIEDCQVCCRPIELHIEIDAEGELAGIQIRRDDD